MKITRILIDRLQIANPTKTRKECAELLGRLLALPVVVAMWAIGLSFCGLMLYGVYAFYKFLGI